MKKKSMRRTAVMIAALAAALGGSFASAEVTAGEQIVNLDLGTGIPFLKGIINQSPTSLANPGFLIGGQYIYQLTPHIGVGADIDDSMYGSADIGVGSGQTAHFTSNHLGVEAMGRYVFMPQSQWNPYLVAGVGLNENSLKATVPAGTAFSGNWASPAYSVGAGVETVLPHSIIAGLEARWRYIGTESYAMNPAITGGGNFSPGGWSELAIAARLGYRFGGK